MNFSSLDDALRYRETCPYCKSNLDVAYIPKSNAYPIVSHEKMYWSLANKEYISVNLATGKVELSSTDKTQGIYYCALKINCEACDCYHHTFNFKFNLTDKAIEYIELNNHSVEFCDDIYKYNINNSKSFGQTTLIKRNLMTSNHKTIQFPYVDIDIENPINTLKRLEGLLAYI